VFLLKTGSEFLRGIRWIIGSLDGFHCIHCQGWKLAIAGDDLRQITVIAVITVITAVGTERLTELVHEFRSD
jgi:hypothetical protein